MAHLTTSSEVIGARGGTKVVADWLRRPQQTVSSWKAGTIPAKYFLVMQSSLAEMGHTVAPSAFGMVGTGDEPKRRRRTRREAA